MDLGLPLEVRSYSQLYFDNSSGDRLTVSLKFKLRELVNKFVNDFAHLRELYYFTNLLGSHLIEVLPSKLLFLFNLSQDVFRQAMILSKRSHRRPLSSLNHFAHAQHYFTELCPSSFNADLKKAS